MPCPAPSTVCNSGFGVGEVGVRVPGQGLHCCWGGRHRRPMPSGGREQGSDFHECDLEAFHHALHVENEGVLVRVVLNDVVVHVHQDATREWGEG